MAAEIVPFQASTEDRDACIAILREALEAAEAGEIIDVAVVTVRATEDGPVFHRAYHADAAFAALVCGVADLAFHLQWARYQDE